MSTSQQPPMSRREARLAAQQAAASSLESLVEPGSADVARPAAPGDAHDSTASASSASAHSAAAPSAPLPPSAPAPVEGRFRARDFRPPAERERAVTSPPSFAAVQPDDQPLEYRTAQRTPSASAHSAPVPSAPVSSAASPSAVSAPAPSAAAPEAPVWMPVLPPMPPTPSAAADPSPAEHEVVADGAPPVEERTMSRRELRARRAADETPEAEAPAAQTGAPAPAAPAGGPVAAPPLALVDPPVVLPGDSAAPQPSTATGSHWSVGAQASDDDPFENTFSRQMGSASASTNVLVLPEMPMAGLTGPVPGTGEIIITGMIDVPKSMSSTGSISAVHESPDIDDLFEAGEREVPSTESTPVSAINAVSGHTATRAVMGGRKPRGNTVTTALVASTVVMAVAAVTVFVVAAANGLF